jgi:hypothetical protein
MEMVVVIGIVAVAVALVLPAVGTARQSAAKTNCQLNIRHISDAALDYGRSHRGRMVADLRWPAWILAPDGTRHRRTDAWNTAPPWGHEMRQRSWLGQLDVHLGDDRRRIDCPLVNDHRKGGYIRDENRYTWDTDYIINRFAINTSIDAAEEPSRAMLFGEPNMPRTALSILPDVLAWGAWWRTSSVERSDLEQIIVGSVSFSFVDGHAVRVVVPRTELPFLAAYPELALSAGSPPTGAPQAMFNNHFWWNRQQVQTPLGFPQPRYPAPNDDILR